MIKYHLGCGSKYFDGYVNVDYPVNHHNINKKIKADVYADLLTMVYENCIEIRSHHVFEHFGYAEAFALLIKWTKALSDMGRLIIEVPDIKRLAGLLASTKDIDKSFNIIRYMYGCQSSHWGYHINNWTPQMFDYILKKFGYENIIQKPMGNSKSQRPNLSLIVTANKATSFSVDDLILISENVLTKYLNIKSRTAGKTTALFGIYKNKLLTTVIGEATK